MHSENSLVSSGCIINGQVENSVLFKKVYVGNNCVIKNSIILNDVYLGDNTHIEKLYCGEQGYTIRANSYHCGEDGIKIVVEKTKDTPSDYGVKGHKRVYEHYRHETVRKGKKEGKK